MSFPRIPNWKKAGLKLKKDTHAIGSPQTSSVPHNGAVTNGDHSNGISAQHQTFLSNGDKKREAVQRNKQMARARQSSTGSESLNGHTADEIVTPLRKSLANKVKDTNSEKKRTLPEDVNGTSQTEVQPRKRRKSVTFADDTKRIDGSSSRMSHADWVESHVDNSGTKGKEKAQNLANGTHGSSSNNPKTHSNDGRAPYVAYLDQYHNDRQSWKFNKAKQTALLKNACDTNNVPMSCEEALVTYVGGLQGQAARERLRASALGTLQDLDAAETDEPSPINVLDPEAQIRKGQYEQALRERLEQTKRRLREAEQQDLENSEEFKAKLKQRQRVVGILLSLAESHQVLPPTPDSSNGGTAPFVALKRITFDDNEEETFQRSLPKADAVQKPKRRGQRRQKIRTGVPDDDDSSSSESDLEHVALDSDMAELDTRSEPRQNGITEVEGGEYSTDSSEEGGDNSSDSDSGSESESQSGSGSDSDSDSSSGSEASVEFKSERPIKVPSPAVKMERPPWHGQIPRSASPYIAAPSVTQRNRSQQSWLDSKQRAPRRQALDQSRISRLRKFRS